MEGLFLPRLIVCSYTFTPHLTLSPTYRTGVLINKHFVLALHVDMDDSYGWHNFINHLQRPTPLRYPRASTIHITWITNSRKTSALEYGDLCVWVRMYVCACFDISVGVIRGLIRAWYTSRVIRCFRNSTSMPTLSVKAHLWIFKCPLQVVRAQGICFNKRDGPMILKPTLNVYLWNDNSF